MDNKTLQTLILNEVKKVLDKYNKLYPDNQIKFGELNYKFNLRGVVAGKASYFKRTLYFNLILAKENFLDFTSNTIPHEVAHLFTRKIYPDSKPHGREWQRIMLTGGYKPVRCHSYDTQTIKAKRPQKITYPYTCKCGKKFNISKLIHGRIKAGQKRYCVKCKGMIYHDVLVHHSNIP